MTFFQKFIMSLKKICDENLRNQFLFDTDKEILDHLTSVEDKVSCEQQASGLLSVNSNFFKNKSILSKEED